MTWTISETMKTTCKTQTAMYDTDKLREMNRRDRRAALRGDKLKNNRKETRARLVHPAPKYTAKEIAEAPTSVERARRMRCVKNIRQHL